MSTNLAALAPPGDLEFSENLPKTPGWESMSGAEREGIQQITSDFVKGLDLGARGALMAQVSYLRAERFLRNTTMSITDWANHVGGPSARSVYRSIEKAQDALKHASEDDLMYLAQHGIPGMGRLQPGSIFAVLPKLPAPKQKTDKARQEWAEQIGKKVKEVFSERRKGRKPILLTEDGAVSSLVLSHRHTLKSVGSLTSAQRRSLLKRAWGYVMENQAIPGTIAVERTPIPDGLIPKRGAPRGSRKKRNKAA